jgi:hypothetical protein
MTFGDLWKILDWSDAEMEEDTWLKENTGDKTDSEFKVKFRMTLVEQALFGEGEQKEEAKYMLHMAGVWLQIVMFLRANGLIIEKKVMDNDRGDRDRSEATEEAGAPTAGGGSGGGDKRDTPPRSGDQATPDGADHGEGD